MDSESVTDGIEKVEQDEALLNGMNDMRAIRVRKTSL